MDLIVEYTILHEDPKTLLESSMMGVNLYQVPTLENNDPKMQSLLN